MLDEVREFLFDSLWYHGGNGVNSDHELGKFFIYDKHIDLSNPNKWDYYKNPCDNCDTLGNQQFKCLGHSRKKPWNTITPNQLIGLFEQNQEFDITKCCFFTEKLQIEDEEYNVVTLQQTKCTKNTIIDDFVAPRDLKFAQNDEQDYIKDIGKCIFAYRQYEGHRVVTIEESKNLVNPYPETQKYNPSQFYSESVKWCSIMYDVNFKWKIVERKEDKKFFKFLILG